MAKNLNIILIIAIGFILLFFIFNNSSSNKNEIDLEKAPLYNYKYYSNTSDTDYNRVINDIESLGSNLSSISNTSQSRLRPVVVEKLKPNLIEIQFHNDYRDTITAINNLVAEKRQRFNIANIPIKYSEPEASEVRQMVSDFVNILNINLKTEVPDHRNVNSGWDEAVPDLNMESGWDKAQKSLGLQSSLFAKPAMRSEIRLIAINYVQKYETEDEIKYLIDLVLQKATAEDQMVIRAGFVQDKRTLSDENNFFVDKLINMQVVIEDVSITGYLSDEGIDHKQLQYDSDKTLFFDYNALEQNLLTDPKYVQKQLMDKYKQRTQEMDMRNATLDEEGRAFHRSLPHLYDFSNIKLTRTIFDDMNDKKVFY